MAQVRAASLAEHLCAAHEERTILVQLDVLAVHGPVKTGPAAPGLKLGVGGEQRLAAGHALIHAVGMVMVERAAEWSFGTFLTADTILLRCELLFPVLLRHMSEIFHVGSPWP